MQGKLFGLCCLFLWVVRTTCTSGPTRHELGRPFLVRLRQLPTVEQSRRQQYFAWADKAIPLLREQFRTQYQNLELVRVTYSSTYSREVHMRPRVQEQGNPGQAIFVLASGSRDHGTVWFDPEVIDQPQEKAIFDELRPIPWTALERSSHQLDGITAQYVALDRAGLVLNQPGPYSGFVMFYESILFTANADPFPEWNGHTLYEVKVQIPKTQERNPDSGRWLYLYISADKRDHRLRQVWDFPIHHPQSRPFEKSNWW